MKTKQKLKDAFVELYTKKGMSGITVNAVTKIAGCNRCTFYNHYETLQSILAEIEDEIIEEFKQVPVDIHLDDTKKSASVFSQIVERIDQYGDAVYCLLGKNGDPAFRQRLKETAKSSFSQVSDKLDEEQLAFLQSYVMSSLLGLIEYWHESGKKYSTEEFIIISQQLIFGGAFGVLNK